MRILAECFTNVFLKRAILLALLWHLVWFFGITIDVKPRPQKSLGDMKIYFLGPVLSDDAFNMIVLSKPEASQTVYRSADELSADLEPEAETLGRRETEDLVSVPSSRTVWGALRGIMGEKRPFASAEFYERLPVNYSKSPFPLTGRLAERSLLYPPDLPEDLTLLSAERIASVGISEFRLKVDRDGNVARAENVISGGDPALDLAWQRYFMEWLFVPSRRQAADTYEEGVVTVDPAMIPRGPLD
ncbi:MAG: hypothetical protein HQL11_00170 [Candidatus Omnitrophica bacterium]|nr:hypothetical protein [Candidatus Omnitrophota bacterium]